MSGVTRISMIVTAILVVAGAASSWRPVAAQATRSDDVLPALLVEVKGLRAAMEQMSSAGPRVQLAVSRLQLQEGRIAGMVRRLDTVRDSAASAQREYDQVRGTLNMLSADKSPAANDDQEGVLARFRSQVAVAKSNVDRLKAEEAQLTSDLGAEQARWTEINQRLDELERALAVKR
jgi:chromosome segregation ATPase